MRRKGFTLIELLIVIAIIAILAAILFPVYARAKNKARQAHCVSNLKQIAIGVLQYCEDYDGYGPSRIDADRLYMWSELLGPYGLPWLNKFGAINPVWVCTSSPVNSYYGLVSNRGGDYTVGGHRDWDINKCVYPADIIMVAECGIEYHPSKPGMYCNTLSVTKPKGDWSAWVYYPECAAHAGGNMGAYFDGHVRWNTEGWIAANYADAYYYWNR